jgi:hypothetical protein
MGTLQNGVASVYHQIVTAVENRKDMQLLLSIGNHVDRKQIGSLPGNAIVVNHAPQFDFFSARQFASPTQDLIPFWSVCSMVFPKLLSRSHVISLALPRESLTRKPDWLCHSKI